MKTYRININRTLRTVNELVQFAYLLLFRGKYKVSDFNKFFTVLNIGRNSAPQQMKRGIRIKRSQL